MADILKEHIENCPKHPMSKLKDENVQLKEKLHAVSAELVLAHAVGEGGTECKHSACKIAREEMSDNKHWDEFENKIEKDEYNGQTKSI
jgi:acetylornithine/succinyldiaminopimelate/putrescine aminotransferase